MMNRMATSFRQQMFLLGASKRWVALNMVLLAVLMLLVLNGWAARVPTIMLAAVLALPVGVIWAVLVWRGETPSRRTYHWSLPVARPAHDLIRVVVGALYLLAAYAVLAAAGALVAAIDGGWERFTAIQTIAWANYILAPLIIYLLVMPNVLWSDYRVTRIIYGAIFGVVIVANILQWIEIDFAARTLHTIIFATEGLGSAMVAGMMPEISTMISGGTAVAGDPWIPAAALWFSIGAVFTLFTALFRPDDLRRRR